MTSLPEQLEKMAEKIAREFCIGAFGPFGVNIEPYVAIVAELIQTAQEPLARELAQARRALEDKDDALQRIIQWADSYPIDIFHEPTKEEAHRAHELLTANGMTLDAFSASMGRHCLKGVGDIARAALNPPPADGK